MRRITISALLGLAIATLSACGADDSSSGSAATGTGKAAAKPLRVAYVSNGGTLNDHSLNQLSVEGLKLAAKKQGITYDVAISKSAADYLPNLSTYAQQGYDLVIGGGFLIGKAIGQAAKQYPDTDFAIVDFSAKDPTIGAAPNVIGVLFKEQEAGYLAGQLAGLVQQTAGFPRLNSDNTLGTIGGMKVPAVDRYLAGFGAGLKAVDPDAKVVNAYSNSFTDQQACSELANSQADAGADMIFDVAGGCGFGALDAIKQKGVWGIANDSDLSYLGDHILTSAVKRIPVAIDLLVSRAIDGTFAGGKDMVLGLAQNGVGLSGTSPKVPKSVLDKVDAARQKIVDGEITVPDTVGKR